MSLPPFSFPFAHWTPHALSAATTADVTISRFISDRLLLAFSSGEIAVFTITNDAAPDVTDSYPDTPHLQARLLGHQSPIIALEPLEIVSETSATDPLFLSLSLDGALSKWSLADNRCLQAMSSTTSDKTRPQGMILVPHSGVGEGRLTDSLILVYGCNTEIVVLNAESLETIFVWPGHVDWPIPVVVERRRESTARECELLTILSNGQVQSWVMTGKREKLSASVLEVSKREDLSWSVKTREDWGRVRWWQKLVGGYLVVQSRGFSFHVAVPATESGFILKSEVGVEEGITGVEVGTALKTVIIKTDVGTVKIYRLRKDELELLAVSTPADFLKDERIMSVVAFFDATTGKGKIAISSRPKVRTAVCGNPSGLDISITEIARDNRQLDITTWNQKALTKSIKKYCGSRCSAASTCSEIFTNMVAIAHGGTVNLYSLSSFLLSYHEPTRSIDLGADNLSICLLKRVRIGEYIGHGRNSGVYGGKEYLVAGTKSGDLFVIESPSYHCSQRIPLFPSPVISAHLLPSNLGRRLRSTLLVSSADGTASIVDIERSRVMVTFPSHDYSYIDRFATKQGQNLIALTYQDGVRREWSMGEEDGGVLINPPPSRGSVAPREEKGLKDNSSDGEWKVVHRIARELYVEDREEEGELHNGDGTLQLWNGFCRIGLPTVGIDVRAVLQGLETAIETASQRTRPAERKVVGNHPAITNAKCLLTALAPGGTLDLFLESDDDGSGQEEGDDGEWGSHASDDLGEWRFAVDQFFFRRKTPATQGLIGAGNRISMLTTDAMGQKEVSPTVTSIKLLAVLTLISSLLEATGKKELKPVVLQKMLRSHLGKKRVALGAFAKFWSDANPLIRWVARECLDAFMSALTEEERNNVVEYWRGYLPVHVPPELSSAKEVSRSVILLGKLITDYDHGYDASLKKAVAKSAELLLNETTPLYQDTAIEVIGYSWSAFENLFDAYEVIHALVRISTNITPESRRATLHRCILDIAAKNSPLLASSLANNISRGTPSSTPTASLAAHALQGLATVSTAAMRIVTHIVRTDAILFRDVLALLVEAVVKILDPNGGLREKVLPTVTELVDSMVEAYPTLAFHRPTQRLALSTAPGIIVVYDLKSCTTAHVLDGHHHLATFLRFSTDGRYIAAVDLDEDLLFVWRFVSGIWSVIGQATTGESDKALAPRVKKSFVNSHKVGMVDVVWSAERTVKVFVGVEETVVDV